MVLLSKSHYYAERIRKPVRNYLKTGFLDSIRVFVRAGTGGNGYPKFGGIGGQGGDVIAVGKKLIFLEDVVKANSSKRYVAQSGRNSTHNFIFGPPGETLKFDVPVGVSLYTDLGKKLGEVNQEGEEVIVARGGPGGHPKNGFLGIHGQSYGVKLDLKLIADIGLVGFPNAGKSTLLKAVSLAKPKIANYPFTTIKPNVGIMTYNDFRKISMADLPGLIEGAHANRGMGHQFLRHVERTKLLLLVVDINGFQLGHQYEFRSCLDTIVLLNKELELYNPDLLNKPAIIIINKMDTEGAHEKLQEIRHHIKNLSSIFKNYPEEMRPSVSLHFEDILPISAKEEGGDILMVKDKLRHCLDVHAELAEEEDMEENAQLMETLQRRLNEKGPRVA